MEGAFDRLQQVAVVRILNEMGHDFGIRFRRKLIALNPQLFAQFIVILNDAVVHHHNRAIMACMWVRIFPRRLTMRGPTCVSHADRAGKLAIFELGSQRGHLAFISHPKKLLIFDDGNASGIVTAILEPLQTANQDGNCRTYTNIANNAAHNAPPHTKLERMVHLGIHDSSAHLLHGRMTRLSKPNTFSYRQNGVKLKRKT